MKYNWVYIGLVVALSVFALQFWDSTPKLLLQPDDEEALYKHFPYAMIDDAHSKHFDKQGALSYELAAQKLRHFRQRLDMISKNDFTSMDTLEVTLHTNDSKWFITADKGTLMDSGDTLTLESNIRIWRPLENGQSTELTTSRLLIRPKSKVISTQQPVTIVAPQGEINAIGMTVDLETENIRLLHQVRGHHEPIR